MSLAEPAGYPGAVSMARRLATPDQAAPVMVLERSPSGAYFLAPRAILGGVTPPPALDGPFLYAILDSEPGRVLVRPIANLDATNTPHRAITGGQDVRLAGQMLFDEGDLVRWNRVSADYDFPPQTQSITRAAAPQRLLPMDRFAPDTNPATLEWEWHRERRAREQRQQQEIVPDGQGEMTASGAQNASEAEGASAFAPSAAVTAEDGAFAFQPGDVVSLRKRASGVYDVDGPVVPAGRSHIPTPPPMPPLPFLSPIPESPDYASLKSVTDESPVSSHSPASRAPSTSSMTLDGVNDLSSSSESIDTAFTRYAETSDMDGLGHWSRDTVINLHSQDPLATEGRGTAVSGIGSAVQVYGGFLALDATAEAARRGDTSGVATGVAGLVSQGTSVAAEGGLPVLGRFLQAGGSEAFNHFTRTPVGIQLGGEAALGSNIARSAPLAAAVLATPFMVYSAVKDFEHAADSSGREAEDAAIEGGLATVATLGSAGLAGASYAGLAGAGPAGLMLGIGLMAADDVLTSEHYVEQVDARTHLSAGEKILTGLRAFIGLDAPETVMERIEQVEQAEAQARTDRAIGQLVTMMSVPPSRWWPGGLDNAPSQAMVEVHRAAPPHTMPPAAIAASTVLSMGG